MGFDRVRHQVADSIKDALPLQTRGFLVRSRLKARHLTASARGLPDFVILGCQRGGTSSLYKYLGRHPQISPSLRKETEFFSINYSRGEEWYRAHFPLRARSALSGALGSRRLLFEATPDYLLDPRAPGRLREMIPEAKLIVLLREPGERALSHYKHNVRLELESEPFERALELEEERLAGDLERLRTGSSDRLTAFRRYSYVTRGLYSEQVGRWLDVFPRNQFLFLESEQFFADPASVLLRILGFVQAKPWTPAEFRNYSYRSGADAGHQAVSPTARATMDESFAASNESLKSMVPDEIEWLHSD